jgi:hypothetical protein
MGTTRDNFQKAGEVCETCKDFWKSQSRAPKKLVALPSVTQVYHSEVAVCPYCDGEPIVRFAAQNFKQDA